MSVTGRTDFRGGITLSKRVLDSAPVVLNRMDGFNARHGYLEMEYGVSQIGSAQAPWAAPTGEQTPAIFRDGSGVRVIVCDAAEKICEAASGVFGPEGPTHEPASDGIPVRLGRQIILPKGSDDKQLMVYEPNAPAGGTKYRPLSVKSPADYVSGEKPVVTPSPDPSLQVFNCGDGGASAWTNIGATTVTSTATQTAITIPDSVSPGAMIAKKAISGGISLSGKSYFVLDAMLIGDPQLYTLTGLYPNAPDMLPSGYVIALYSDTACTTLITSMFIPRMLASGMIHRFAFNIGESSLTIRGVAILTAPSWWQKPAAGTAFTLTLFSEPYSANWQYAGNVLMPGIQWQSSPIVDDLSEQITGGASTTVPSMNVVKDPGFERAGCPDWVLGEGSGGGGASQKPSGDEGFSANSCNYCIELDYGGPGGGAPEWAEQHGIPVNPGVIYGIDVWYLAPNPARGYPFHILLTFQTATGTTILTTRLPGTGQEFSVTPSANWQKIHETFTPPAGTTQMVCRITNADVRVDYPENFRIDDVAIYPVDQTTVGSAVLLHTFTPGATHTTFTPAIPLVEWCYCFAARDLLGADDWKWMVSNPSDPSTASDGNDIVADPWRTYTVAVTLPGGTEATFLDDYGDYAKNIVFYRRTLDPTINAWGDWTFAGYAPIAATVSFTDLGTDLSTLDDPSAIGGVDVPYYLEFSNDYASPAAIAVYADQRVYAAKLDWDQTSGNWKRATAIEVSSYQKPWAFPTTVDQNSPSSDGSELDGYAVTGSEVRGILARGVDKFVWLDNEMFLLRGDNPITGWEFYRLDSIGLVSQRSLADCRSAIIWHDGHDFYAWSGGTSVPISRDAIDSSKIDWKSPHNAVYFDDQYFFFCRYGGEWAMLIYDLLNQYWRMRVTPALSMVGAGTDGESIYIVQGNGVVKKPFFDGTPNGWVEYQDFGVDPVFRVVETSFISFGPPSVDLRFSELLLDVDMSDWGNSYSLDVTVSWQGAQNGSKVVTISLSPNRTRYTVNLNVLANAVKVSVPYGPRVYFIGLRSDEAPARC